MQERLLELLFEHQLRILLAVYDTDYVLRWTANNCSLFGVNVKEIQYIIITLLNDPCRKLIHCRKEAVTLLRQYKMKPCIIKKTLNLNDNEVHLIYNYKTKPYKILPPQYTPELRETMKQYMNAAHMLKEFL